jgi:hypothetical protein
MSVGSKCGFENKASLYSSKINFTIILLAVFALGCQKEAIPPTPEEKAKMTAVCAQSNVCKRMKKCEAVKRKCIVTKNEKSSSENVCKQKSKKGPNTSIRFRQRGVSGLPVDWECINRQNLHPSYREGLFL